MSDNACNKPKTWIEAALVEDYIQQRDLARKRIDELERREIEFIYMIEEAQDVAEALHKQLTDLHYAPLPLPWKKANAL